MAYFPRKGTELSDECELHFSTGKLKRPSIVHRFENGSRSARFLTQKAEHEFTVTFTGAADDFGAVTDFFDLHGNVTPFILDHPDYGVGQALFVNDSIEIPKVVRGNPPWFRIEMQIEAVF